MQNGASLSRRQRQLLSIACAAVANLPVMILDEATSALDPETEVKVLKAVKALSHKPTCIIITHRPSALNVIAH